MQKVQSSVVYKVIDDDLSPGKDVTFLFEKHFVDQEQQKFIIPYKLDFNGLFGDPKWGHTKAIFISNADGVLCHVIPERSPVYVASWPPRCGERFLNHSQSQLGQDQFVLATLAFKRKGFFVEFGATDGLELNNTYSLEKEFQWQGILCEPARNYQEALRRNRPNCKLDERAVYKESGVNLEFSECINSQSCLSTLSEFTKHDFHARKISNVYQVESVSLLDLLKQHLAPKIIDYLSIDTEGSEFAILNAFDFSQYTFRVITVEHNNTKNREKIYALLTSNGYVRSRVDSKFDDWYTHDSLYQS